ncbi:mechanosensitive ion channel domain-containing protein [Devosia sp. 919]|uniref:mechanosensitive ion channel domain-containing protein n=1 Tax=Devosia sp. 919 TaxID=2726065 RepID=UPI001554648B|nr:mechanosensitive ion channel domain-containing protein [Devosia sp. 919]
MILARILLILCMLAPALTGGALAQVPLLPSADQPATASDSEVQDDQSVRQLIEILENDAARQALIERLEGAAGQDASATIEEPAPTLSVARQLAEHTRALSKTAGRAADAFVHVVQDFRGSINAALSTDFAQVRTAAWNLALVAAGLFGSLMALRIVVIWLQQRLAGRVAARGWRVRTGAVVAAALIDGASVLMSWGIGFATALTLARDSGGQVGVNESLLLNAFLLVELSKLLVHTVFSPRSAALRWIPLSNSDAAYWSFCTGRLISLLGYTFFFVAPVLSSSVSRDAAAAVQVIAMTASVALAIIVVLQCKEGARARLTEVAAERGNDGVGQALLLVGRYWHVVAIAYLLTLLVAWFANPDGALPFMLGATFQTAIAVLAGMAISGAISRVIRFGLSLPEDVRQNLPLLETRLQAFVPRVMQIIRLVVVAGVVLAVVQAWGMFDALGWLGSERGQEIVGSLIAAAFIVLACVVLYIVVASWIEFRLSARAGKMPTAREKTLLSLFKNAFTIALVVFGVMLALAQIGVNIAPLLAGAGVLGLAIGFGSQKLVQDIITGIFIQFENVMNEGDVVEAGGKSGVVEKLTIRSVSIRDQTGTLHLIPFSSVDLVSNMVKGFSFHVAEISVAYESDISVVKQALRDAFERLLETEHKNEIIDELDMQGIIAFGDSAVVVRVRIKTLPGKHWGTGRTYSEIVKTVFEERGIEIPYPHITYVRAKGAADASVPFGGDDNQRALA